MPVQNIMCLLFARCAREPINYSHMPNKQGDQKFDHPFDNCL